jgi:hypothetical protein
MFNYFFLENRAIYEILWKNIVVPDTPQMTISRMRIACWLPKTIDTLSMRNTYCFSTATMVMRNRLNVTFPRTLPSCLQ